MHHKSEKKMVELIPRNMTIHIASWKEDNGVSIFSKALENREIKVTKLSLKE